MVLPLGSLVFSLGELLEIGAAFELLDDLQRLLLGLHEDVPRLHLVDRRRVGDFLVVAGADFRVGDLAGHFGVDQRAVQRALAQEFDAPLELRRLVEARPRPPLRPAA